MYAVYDNDIIIAKVSSPVYTNSVVIPSDLEGITIDQIRFNGSTIIDVSSYTTFYIDSDGEKHIAQNTDNTYQELECKWDDDIKQDSDGKWYVSTLEDAKTKRMQDVYNLRKDKENAGIVVDGFFVDTSQTGRLNMSSTLSAYDMGLLDQDATVNWKIKDGDFKAVGLDELKNLAAYMAKYIEDLFNTELQHDTNINNLTTVDDVNNYDITINWPPTTYTTTTTS